MIPEGGGRRDVGAHQGDPLGRGEPPRRREGGPGRLPQVPPPSAAQGPDDMGRAPMPPGSMPADEDGTLDVRPPPPGRGWRTFRRVIHGSVACD